MDLRLARCFLIASQFVIVKAVRQRRSLRHPNIDPATCTEAVLVEPRALHYSTVPLKSAVGVPGIDLITFAHGKNNAQFAKDLVEGDTNLEKAYDQGLLRLLPLPVGDLGSDNVLNKMPRSSLMQTNSSHRAGWHHEYTRLMINPGFWNLLRCDRTLIFQSDTVFCRGSSAKIKDFAAFPYIGGETPSLSIDGRIHMNGGFSLRSRAAMLKCIDELDNEVKNKTDIGEDDIYSQCPSLKQPPRWLVDRFAIDNALKLPRSAPLGVHKPWGSGNGYLRTRVTKLCDGAQALTDAFYAEPRG